MCMNTKTEAQRRENQRIDQLSVLIQSRRSCEAKPTGEYKQGTECSQEWLDPFVIRNQVYTGPF